MVCAVFDGVSYGVWIMSEYYIERYAVWSSCFVYK